jgi:hypothetical protein
MHVLLFPFILFLNFLYRSSGMGAVVVDKQQLAIVANAVFVVEDLAPRFLSFFSPSSPLHPITNIQGCLLKSRKSYKEMLRN